MSNYNTLYVGLDIHKETIVAACISGSTGEITGEVKFPNDLKKLRNYLKQLEKRLNGKILACYEAGCMGYALQREIERWGYTCKIVAPTLIPKRPGDRCKTDRHDAEKLANLFFSNQLTFITIPDEKDEPVRDLLRYRDVLRKEILQSKHYVLKFLLRKGFRYTSGKAHWTRCHWEWLRSIHFEYSLDQELFQEYLVLLEFKLQRQNEIDRRITELSKTPRYSEKVRYLSAYRGIDIYSAMVLLLETGDFNRFPKAMNYMSFLGLVPSEYSSGGIEKRDHITKTGNSHCRHILVQAAWNYSRPVRIENIVSKLSGMPPWVSSQVIQAQERLYRKYWKLARQKSPRIAVIAVAREFAGFIWAMMKKLQEEKAYKSAA